MVFVLDLNLFIANLTELFLLVRYFVFFIRQEEIVHGTRNSGKKFAVKD
jgi:hypothetical protein